MSFLHLPKNGAFRGIMAVGAKRIKNVQGAIKSGPNKGKNGPSKLTTHKSQSRPKKG